MRELSALELLEVWERGRPALPVERALLLLEAVQPSEPPGSVAAWSIGRRDAALIELRRRWFGEAIECATQCGACGETLELTMNAAELLALRDERDERIADDADASDDPEPWLLDVHADAAHVRLRLPTSADVLAVAQTGEGGLALLERCLIDVELEADAGDGNAADDCIPDMEAASRPQHPRPSPGRALDARDEAGLPGVEPPISARLSRETIDSISAAIAAADPLADLELDGVCPACRECWVAPFAIESFLWSELETWALSTLRDVHVLASAYGWSEPRILALSPARRAAYLELAGA